MSGILDQALHFAAGMLIVAVASIFVPLPAAIGIALIAGVVREIYQRYDSDLHWYECGAGCRLDLMFWSLGAGAGAAIMYFLR